MYAFSVELKQPFKDFDNAVEKVKECLMAEKMGVVSEVNVSGILRAKMALDYPNYRILGACVPALAKRVLDIDPESGALLPCNVIVREEGDIVMVTFMDPRAVLNMANDPDIDRVAEDAMKMLEAVKARLG